MTAVNYSMLQYYDQYVSNIIILKILAALARPGYEYLFTSIVRTLK